MNPEIFREYDIRGIVGTDLTDASVRTIGRAFGSLLAREGGDSAVLGRDVRLSSEGFARAMAAGLAETGIDVIDVGLVTTPVLYFAALHLSAAGGVMITGSHNPIEYNGIKLCRGITGLTGEEIQGLRRSAEAGSFATASRQGAVSRRDVMEAYEADLAARFAFRRRLRVVVDAGNGVAGIVAPRVLRRLGHDVEELWCEPDGRFPNHLPDPEVPEYVVELARRVVASRADLGLGFDGDGDRVGLIDGSGRKISADWFLLALAREQLRRHPGGTVRFDVKCSDFLEADIRARGGVPLMGRTGHSILKRDVVASGAVLGGELSGHIVFGRDFPPIDDALYAAARFLEILDRTGSTAVEIFADFPRTFSTAEIKAPCPDGRKFAVVDAVRKALSSRGRIIDLDGARVEFDDGWGLVRASNTTACLTLRFEARSDAALRRIRDLFRRELDRHPEVDGSLV